MLISCSSCNSKYLVNSADLKPSGRNVKCANCGNSWFQNSFILDDEENSKNQKSEKNSKDIISEKNSRANLPSTIVNEPQPSIINSILVIFFIFLLLAAFWFYKQNGINFFVFIQYYIQEFKFNSILIINDLAKIFHEIFS
tara:strand:+ start:2148 stop:2570 length:423 start_codon:yes stop_codon:yes gene_type:complete